MLVRQVGSQPPRFGAVYLEPQTEGKPNVDLKNVATDCSPKKSHHVVSLDKSHSRETLDTRAKVEVGRSQAQSEGSPFHLKGNIVVANTPKE